MIFVTYKVLYTISHRCNNLVKCPHMFGSREALCSSSYLSCNDCSPASLGEGRRKTKYGKTTCLPQPPGDHIHSHQIGYPLHMYNEVQRLIISSLVRPMLARRAIGAFYHIKTTNLVLGYTFEET